MRDAAGEFDDLRAAGDFAPCVRQHLAVLVGDEARQGFALALQELAELEQHARPSERRGRCPGGERRRRRLYRRIDLADASEGNATGALAGRRIEHIAPAPARPVDALAVDEMLDVAHAAPPAG